MTNRHPHFVPNNTAGSKTETAVLLVGTADEFGISQSDIVMVSGGYRITEALADVLYEESNDEPDSGDKPPEKTSGNRAGKNKKNSKEE